MSMRFKGGVISATPPTITPPVDGEGGSASGVWTLQTQLQNAAIWPKPVLPRELYAWGFNANGQLGLNNTNNRSSPVQIGSLITWKTSCGGSDCTAAITGTGGLYMWGQNSQGKLGLGDTAARSSPVQVGALTNWLQVSTNYNSTLAVKTDGTLWAWGNNSYGRLGLNDTANRSSPVQVGALTNWAIVSVGQIHAVAIKTDGTFWAWGYGLFGCLGLNNTTTHSSPVQVGALTNWSRIQETGRLWTIARKTDGTMWSWGNNGNGQLGQNNTTYRSSPVQVGALTTWSTVSGGYSTGFAIKTDGTLWSFGNNNHGQLGQSDTTVRSSPVQVGALATWRSISQNGGDTSAPVIATKTDGTMWSWGRNHYGQLGQSDTTNRSSPVQVGALTTWPSAPSASGRRAAIAIKTT
jgi:alpha-tubulin suppressor-like RCC1 family protein